MYQFKIKYMFMYVALDQNTDFSLYFYQIHVSVIILNLLNISWKHTLNYH